MLQKVGLETAILERVGPGGTVAKKYGQATRETPYRMRWRCSRTGITNIPLWSISTFGVAAH